MPVPEFLSEGLSTWLAWSSGRFRFPLAKFPVCLKGKEMTATHASTRQKA